MQIGNINNIESIIRNARKRNGISSSTKTNITKKVEDSKKVLKTEEYNAEKINKFLSANYASLSTNTEKTEKRTQLGNFIDLLA